MHKSYADAYSYLHRPSYPGSTRPQDIYINYDGNKNYDNYLNKEIHASFTLTNIDEDAINKIIYNLPPKRSSGCDGISSKLLKVIAPVIIKPLTLLINQVLNTGTCPDKLKTAKVIPIFKKGTHLYLKIICQFLVSLLFQKY